MENSQGAPIRQTVTGGPAPADGAPAAAHGDFRDLAGSTLAHFIVPQTRRRSLPPEMETRPWKRLVVDLADGQ